MLDVVQVALKNIFEPMAQSEREMYISFLRTQFESSALRDKETPKVVDGYHRRRGARSAGRKGKELYYMKVIESVDETKKGAYAFDGKFISTRDLPHLEADLPVLIGTYSTPKKYALAKTCIACLCEFEGAEKEQIRVDGLRLVCVDADIQVLIDTLKRFDHLKS